VEQARESGVEAVVSIGIDAASSRLAIDLAERLEGVYATVGLHPHDAGSLDDALLGELEALAAHSRVVAVGECGLDFYRDLSPRDAQRRAFGAQIELARRAGLPLVVHVREAGDAQHVEVAVGIDERHGLGRWAQAPASMRGKSGGPTTTVAGVSSPHVAFS
jgi:Tat protein secretion system quality control protein TatD with DNase activity